MFCPSTFVPFVRHVAGAAPKSFQRVTEAARILLHNSVYRILYSNTYFIQTYKAWLREASGAGPRRLAGRHLRRQRRGSEGPNDHNNNDNDTTTTTNNNNGND